jgi:hypothetical protein
MLMLANVESELQYSAGKYQVKVRNFPNSESTGSETLFTPRKLGLRQKNCKRNLSTWSETLLRAKAE